MGNLTDNTYGIVVAIISVTTIISSTTGIFLDDWQWWVIIACVICSYICGCAKE
jgi:hypothetical protein